MAIKYKWLANRLKEQFPLFIKKGISKLPSEAELSRKYKVSRQTVRQALSLLEKEGLIEKHQGSGSHLTGLSDSPEKNKIALLISNDSEYLYPRLLNDIQTTLSQNGFSLSVHLTHASIFTEHEILQSFLKIPPRGIIIEGIKTALPNPNLSLYQTLQKKNCSIIFIEESYPSLNNVISIKSANYSGAETLVQFLFEKGHHKIGALLPSDSLCGLERYQGFIESMLAHSLPIPDEQISWFHSDDYQKLLSLHNTLFIKKAIQESFHSCTAIICFNDITAYYLINELSRQSPSLAEEITVVSFDSSYLSTSDSRPFLSLHHKKPTIGVLTAQTLINSLKGLPVSSTELPFYF